MDEAKAGQIQEGQLYKYTNVMKGWQHRWFILNPETGVLEYYMCEGMRNSRPRGFIHLAGAVVSPSEEDSNTFNVNSANGEIYRLRALNAKERQLWVNRLRSVAERHGQELFHTNARSTGETKQLGSANVPAASDHVSHQANSAHAATARAQQRVMGNTRSLYDAFSAAQEILVMAELNHHALAKSIEDLPVSGADVRCMDPDMLLMKAVSQATLLCLKQCLAMLQHQQQSASFQMTGVTGGATMEWLDPFSYALNWNSNSPAPSLTEPIAHGAPLQNDMGPPHSADVIEIVSEDEKTDEEDGPLETETGSAEEHRVLVLQRLTQLKLGMDLTQVSLPTFILEPRSLLEMYANFLSHPDMFLRIPHGTTSEMRMLRVVEWYLTSFYAARKGSNAKKPYNPVLGEVFFCSWHVDQDVLGRTHSVMGDDANDTKIPAKTKLKFVAEQVSHHPPASAFYVENSDKTMCLNASICTKSKFMGMSVGVNMVGEATLSLLEHDEHYVLTFPSAYARSILTSPWVELGGKVAINCLKSGYSASITFHIKPFYGGKVHRVSSEVKNAAGSVVCKVHGEWNGMMDFTYANGDVKVVDTTSLPLTKKRVRPLPLQAEIESRKVWSPVTAALIEDDMKLAAEHKRKIEDGQRRKLLHWKDSGYVFSPKYFQSVSNNYQYIHSLNVKS